MNERGRKEPGPYMWEVQIGACIDGREVRQTVVTGGHGDLDWCFLYDSEERSPETLIWAGWAWERVVDVVSRHETK